VVPQWAKQRDVWTQVAFYSGLGFILPASAAGGYLLGYVLDGWLHTSPVLGIVLGFAGAAGGVIEVLRILNRAEKSERRNDSESGPGTGAN
jgi:F0F1-type ATP synthase assembly protein I